MPTVFSVLTHCRFPTYKRKVLPLAPGQFQCLPAHDDDDHEDDDGHDVCPVSGRERECGRGHGRRPP